MGTSSVNEIVYLFGFGFHLSPFVMGPVGPKGPMGPFGPKEPYWPMGPMGPIEAKPAAGRPAGPMQLERRWNADGGMQMARRFGRF